MKICYLNFIALWLFVCIEYLFSIIVWVQKLAMDKSWHSHEVQIIQKEHINSLWKNNFINIIDMVATTSFWGLFSVIRLIQYFSYCGLWYRWSNAKYNIIFLKKKKVFDGKRSVFFKMQMFQIDLMENSCSFYAIINEKYTVPIKCFARWKVFSFSIYRKLFQENCEPIFNPWIFSLSSEMYLFCNLFDMDK